MARLGIGCAVAVIVLTSGSSLGAADQPWTPPKPTNLKVLDKNLSGREVVTIMKGFTRGLGVRCSECHVYKGKEPNDLASFDFASDEKEHKETARAMLRMVSAINNDLLKGVGHHADSPKPRVTCYTCHRGEKEPLTEKPEPKSE